MTDRIRINLATEPLKNRRFFWILVGSQIALAAAVIFISIIGIVRYSRGTQILKNAIVVKETLKEDLSQKQRRFEEEIDQAKVDDNGRIDFWNRIIRMKSFSWSEFLSDMEELIPDSSYIVSLAPNLKEESKMEVQIRLASPSLLQLVDLYNQLQKRNFQPIKVSSETTSPNGYLIWEISFVYQRMD